MHIERKEKISFSSKYLKYHPLQLLSGRRLINDKEYDSNYNREDTSLIRFEERIPRLLFVQSREDCRGSHC